MAWEFASDRPLYLQLIERIQLRIVIGEYPAGSKLPAVRELAAQAAVNPNTMQKALGELERNGLVRTQRTSGRYITEDQSMIESVKSTLAKEQIDTFLRNMEAIGFNRTQTLLMISHSMQEAISPAQTAVQTAEEEIPPPAEAAAEEAEEGNEDGSSTGM